MKSVFHAFMGFRLFAAVIRSAASGSGAMALHAAWIPLKAELAQWLIERSWEEVQRGGPGHPWPWADTRPAAVLAVPQQGIRLLVLEGNSGRNLAFGPVMDSGVLSGRDLVISGHRDTHFGFLRTLSAGDRVLLTRPEGDQWYEVNSLEVVDSRQQSMVIEPGIDRLSLVTCYPFDSALAGGPLRYVVTALPLKPRRSLSSG